MACAFKLQQVLWLPTLSTVITVFLPFLSIDKLFFFKKIQQTFISLTVVSCLIHCWKIHLLLFHSWRKTELPRGGATQVLLTPQPASLLVRFSGNFPLKRDCWQTDCKPQIPSFEMRSSQTKSHVLLDSQVCGHIIRICNTSLYFIPGGESVEGIGHGQQSLF